jgi:hypothetical protein
MHDKCIVGNLQAWESRSGIMTVLTLAVRIGYQGSCFDFVFG